MLLLLFAVCLHRTIRLVNDKCCQLQTISYDDFDNVQLIVVCKHPSKASFIILYDTICRMRLSMIWRIETTANTIVFIYQLMPIYLKFYMFTLVITLNQSADTPQLRIAHDLSYQGNQMQDNELLQVHNHLCTTH